ncbi:MAG: FecR family protein [Prevotella sp.]|jgi:ferric-dicitrate binding protein FerR (iron transport regulator)|nr:FecR family protein [Prevotella sp.]MCI1686136.1 FecR family protein [Prevotella sp.]MCI1781571.1 FecR family protein [Prevotella sp.]MCI1802155.1 FecR family protein [Prevotella sp.]MCI1817358.1 FecR family protein [Prevotella sp.]
MDDKKIIDGLVASYLRGQISKEDFHILTQKISESKEIHDFVRNLIEIWFSTDVIYDRNSYNTNVAFKRFKNRIGYKKLQNKWKMITVAVAAVTLLLIISFSFYIGNNRLQMSQLIEISAPNGSRLDCTLPDGTKITLNSDSKLTYSRGFGITNREVSLMGEALFNVKPDQKMPFIVNTKCVKMTDIGTRFFFRDYPMDRTLYVKLIEGSVSVHNNMIMAKDLVLQSGEMAIMNKKTGVMHVMKTPVSMLKENDMDIIFFDNLPLQKIARILQRAYGVDVTVAETSKDKCFYGRFNRKYNSFQDVIDNLASTNALRYKRNGNKYILY